MFTHAVVTHINFNSVTYRLMAIFFSKNVFLHEAVCLL